jgi:hypothetical protein
MVKNIIPFGVIFYVDKYTNNNNNLGTMNPLENLVEAGVEAVKNFINPEVVEVEAPVEAIEEVEVETPTESEEVTE